MEGSYGRVEVVDDILVLLVIRAVAVNIKGRRASCMLGKLYIFS